jgi:PBSX family phage terminase large subunit
MAQIKLHKFQTQALKSKARFVALIAGTGGGKSYTGPPWLSREIEKYPKDTFLVVSPTYKMLQRATIPTLMNCYQGTYFQGEFKESKMQYLLPTGGIIYFGSAENPDFLEGLHARAAWLDEASLMSRHLWIVAQSRVGAKMGRILITTSPRGTNWLFHDVYKKFLAGDPDYDVIKFRSCDSPYYPKEEFLRAQKTYDSRTFESRYCGEFRKFEGLVYPDFSEDNLIDSCNVPFVEVRAGVDWGFTHPSVILVLGKDAYGIWYLIEEWVERGKLLDNVITQAMLLQNKYRISAFFCDRSQPAYIQTFLGYGLNAFPADNSITAGVGEVAMMIKAKNLKIMRSCKNTIDELETYHYPEESAKDLPAKEDDDCMDALRYAIRGTGEVQQPEEFEIVGIEEIMTPEDAQVYETERVRIGGNYD